MSDPMTHAAARLAAHAPVLVGTDADTPVGLPHLTWGQEWRPVLRRFAAAAADMKPVRRVSYEPLPLHVRLAKGWSRLGLGRPGDSSSTSTWHVPVTDVRDRGLRREMLGFAEALYEWEPPSEGAVILTGMLDGPGEGMLHLIGWLRAALAQLSGHAACSIAAPTGHAGDDDGSLAPHSDMWIPALLLNVFDRVVHGQGASLLLPVKRAFELAAEVGVPAEVRAQMREAIAEAGECGSFEHFNGLMYGNHPWTDRLRAALFAAAEQVAMAPGQGYLTDDRRWLHGRTRLAPDAVPEALRERRLYRLAYNNRRLQEAAAARRIEWAPSGRTARGG